MRTLLATSLAAAFLALPAAPAQALGWQPCNGEYECATLRVPLDRAAPQGPSTRLRLIRRLASGDDRHGSLIFNPGGPGGSGVSSIEWAWQNLPAAVKHHYDLVTWDPRGINTSTPNLDECQSVPLRLPATGRVDWAHVAQAFVRDIARSNRACQRSRPRVVAHMSTNQNVADLDAVRAAVGDSKLTYWGMSYGTRIGYVYALTHPERVRAIVLDGSIDPAGSTLGLGEGGAGPDQAFGAFTDAYPAARRQFNQLMTRLDEGVVRLPGRAVLDRWVVRDVIFNSVAQQAAYPGIAQFIALAHRAVFDDDGQARRQMAQTVPAVRQMRLHNGNAGGAFAVTNCTDYPGRPTVRQALGTIRQQVALGPNYGGVLATQYVLGCAGLTVTPDPVPRITGRGSTVPVLVLGASRDGSTVNAWTARMSRAFPRSRTVTYAGGQHVTWGAAGSACVDEVANTYVLTGRLPLADVGCSNAVVR